MFWISAYPTTIIAHLFLKTITRLKRIFLTQVECRHEFQQDFGTYKRAAESSQTVTLGGEILDH